MRFEQEKSYEYIQQLLGPESNLVQKSRQASAELGLAGISLSSVELSIIKFLVKAYHPQHVLEIGCLTGTSALHLLEALGDKAFVTTLEKSDLHAEKAKEVLSAFIQQKRCDVIVGDARDILQNQLKGQIYDFILIDANKAAYLEYFNWSIEHIRTGGMIVVDNVFLSGAVWGQNDNQKFNAKQVDQVHKMNQLAFQHKNLQSCLVPTTEGLLFSQKI